MAELAAKPFVATLTTPMTTDQLQIGRFVPVSDGENGRERGWWGNTLGNEREDADKVCLTYEGNEATDKINELELFLARCLCDSPAKDVLFPLQRRCWMLAPRRPCGRFLYSGGG